MRYQLQYWHSNERVFDHLDTVFESDNIETLLEICAFNPWSIVRFYAENQEGFIK